MCSKIRKTVSILITIAFLFTNTGYAAPSPKSVFKNKTVDYKKLSDQNKQNLDKRQSILGGEEAGQKESQRKEAQKILSSHLQDLSQIHIPLELGRVIEAYQSSANGPRTTSGEPRLVVHIQDIHTNPEAEFNLAKILEILLNDYNLGMVCSEGADGIVDTKVVSSFPDYSSREKVAKVFVNSGELTGEEYLGITKYPDLAIWGIEDRDIYFKNIIEFNRIMRFNPGSQAFISQAKNALEELKPKIYSKELIELGEKEADYSNHRIETDKYLKELSFYIQRFNIPFSDYKNIALLNETINEEPTIDQSKIMQESQNLILNLQSAIAAENLKTEIDSLMAKAQLFKEQKISPFSFYSYLNDMALKHIPGQIAKYPGLNSFVGYLTKLNSLDSTKLFIELEALTYDIKQRLAQNDQQKTLTQCLRNIKFLEGFFNLKISNEELDYYMQNKGSHKVGFFENFINPNIKRYSISAFVDFNPALIDNHLQELEDFYKTVRDRDIAMVNNSLSEIEKRNIKVSALISGGFHTKGITRLLKEKGYSYIVVSPYSKTEIDEENYHFLLSGRRKQITELLKQLDLNEILNRLSAGLRVPLAIDADLTEAFNRDVAPALAKIWGLEDVKDAQIEPFLARISIALGLKKGADLWKMCPVGIEIRSSEAGAVVASCGDKIVKLTRYNVFFVESGEFKGKTIAVIKPSVVSAAPTAPASLASNQGLVLSPVTVITSADPAIRDTSEEDLFEPMTTEQLLAAADELEAFRTTTANLYDKLRASTLLFALYRFHLMARPDVKQLGLIPFEGLDAAGGRKFDEAIKIFRNEAKRNPNRAVYSALAGVYYDVLKDIIKAKVKESLHTNRGNEWLYDVQDLSQYAEHVRVPEAFLQKDTSGNYPVLTIECPIRIEWTSTVARDIFGIAMGSPNDARVINLSADLGIAGEDTESVPPSTAYVRVIDAPVIRIRSVDLKVEEEIKTLEELFNFTTDLSLLHAALTASGIVPPSFEGRKDITLKQILEKLVGKGRGIELVTRVSTQTWRIPKGSGLAVSTTLLATMNMALTKFTGQLGLTPEAITNITEDDKMKVVAMTTLGEWLGGSGGGWQDAGGMWGGFKQILGQRAQEGDTEFGVTPGKLLPRYIPLTDEECSPETRQKLMDSMVIVHGGAAQDVGPVLWDATIAYLLRTKVSKTAWTDSAQVYDLIMANIKAGDIKELGRLEDEDWVNRITIVPLADNGYIDEVNKRLRASFGEDFWGFDSTGCRGGAGGVYLVNPARKQEFVKAFREISDQVRDEMGDRFPIPIRPVVYEAKINNAGITVSIESAIPEVVLKEDPVTEKNVNIDEMRKRYGFRPEAFARLEDAYRAGQIGLARSKLSTNYTVEDAKVDAVYPTDVAEKASLEQKGNAMIANNEVMEVTLAGGQGARFTGGDVAKPAYPVLKVDGKFRSFVELQVAETPLTAPHVVTESFLTQGAIDNLAETTDDFGRPEGKFYLSKGRNITHKFIPTEADLRYQRSLEAKRPDREEALRDQVLDAIIGWAKSRGEGTMFKPQGTDDKGNTQKNAFVTPGHFYELINMILNGTLAQAIKDNPNLKDLFIHNSDNLGAILDPVLAAMHRNSGKAITAEAAPMTVSLVGGGWAKITDDKGVVRTGVVEQPQFANIADSFKFTRFNPNSLWINIDALLSEIGITRGQLIAGLTDPAAQKAVEDKILDFETRLNADPLTQPLATIREISEARLGSGFIDRLPTVQFERIIGCLTFVLPTQLVGVPKERCQDMKVMADRNFVIRDGLMNLIAPHLNLAPASATPIKLASNQGLTAGSRKITAESMEQIIAVPAGAVIADSQGFETWLGQVAQDNAVVIIAMDANEEAKVIQYGDRAHIRVVGKDLRAGDSLLLTELFAVYGNAKDFNGFKLGTPYTLDQYKGVLNAIGSGV